MGGHRGARRLGRRWEHRTVNVTVTAAPVSPNTAPAVLEFPVAPVEALQSLEVDGIVLDVVEADRRWEGALATGRPLEDLVRELCAPPRRATR